MTNLHDHEPVQFYEPADSPDCPHPTEPNWKTDGEAWDQWVERHPVSDDGRICLDVPAGICCPACTEVHGDAVPWSRCENRKHARPREASTRQHRPVVADVAGLECLERECEEFFTEDGDEIPGKTACSHMRQVEVCDGCTPEPSAQDEFPVVVAWADCPHAKAEAVQR